MSHQYRLAALGGTFDHLHAGHHKLLHAAFDQADSVIIGLVWDAKKSQKVFQSSLQSYRQRHQALSAYLKGNNFSPRFQIIPLHDVYGPTITNNNIDLLVVTNHTLEGAKDVNTKRKQLNLHPLPIHRITLLKDNSGHTISSTRIRQGIIDRYGRFYRHCFGRILTPDENMRRRIGQPQGLVTAESHLTPASLKPFISVVLLGDQVTESFIARKLPFNYAIIDHLINRRPHRTNLDGFQPDFSATVINPPGVILPSAARTIATMLTHSSGLITVEGEEDLLGFPLVAAMPLNSVLVYGQPGKGVVVIPITEPEKARLLNLILPVDQQFAITSG